MSKFHGVPIEPLTPGSDEWLRTISASKISAILGLSPYDSPYSLWCRMTYRIPQQPGSKATVRGTYLEPAVLQWLKDQHPELRVKTGLSFAHPWRDTWTAAPDGVAYPGRKRTPHALVEIKTAYRADEWGQEGTAQIPPGYLVQVAWQLHVTGAERCLIGALINMELREYVVTQDDVAPHMRNILAQVHRFEEYLSTDTEPDWDGSQSTYVAACQRPHNGSSTEVDPVIGEEFLSAHAAKSNTEERYKLARNKLMESMGESTLALLNDQKIASRNKAGSLVIARKR